MLSCKFTAEPGRQGLFDCPPEIRNIIYDLAIFGIKRADYTGPELRALDDGIVDYAKWIPELEYIVDGNCFHLNLPSDPRRGYEDDRVRPASVVEQHVLDAIATTNMLCAMTQEARYEARGVFWAKFSHGVSSDVTGVQLFQRYLNRLGAVGRASIRHLPYALSAEGFSYDGYISFLALPKLLHPCSNLQRLDLVFGVNAIFWGEKDMLADYFLAAQPFESPSLETFAKGFQSPPRLQKLNLDIIPSFRNYGTLYRHEPDNKLQFLFSGMREFALCLAIYERFKANHKRLHKGDLRKLGDIVVWLDFAPYVENDEGSDIQSFRDWVVWKDKMVLQYLKFDSTWQRWKMDQEKEQRKW